MNETIEPQQSMIPVFFTRKHFNQVQEAKAAPGAMDAGILYASQGELYSVRRLGIAESLEERSELSFEVEAIGTNHEQQIFIGLMETNKLAISPECPGFAVSISLGAGTVVDLVNGMGILGYMDGAPYDKRQGSISVRVEVDIIGDVCIPKISVNGEVIVHPALRLEQAEALSALVGSTLTERTVNFINEDMRVSHCRERASA